MSTGKDVFEYERAGNVLIVVPTGSLMEFRDNEVRNAYNDTYRYLDEAEITHLLVDFSNLSYFASTFVGMLIRLAKKARLGGGEAVLCNLSDNMKDMMKTLMLLENTKTNFFWVPFDSRTAALASLTAHDAAGNAAAGNAATEDAPASTAVKPAQTPTDDNGGGGGWSRFSKS